MKTLFLDRDGVVTVEGGGYVAHPHDIRYLPGARGALARLNAAGWQILLYTNQSGVGRGVITPEGLADVHEKLRRDAIEVGATILDVYACPHKPDDNCTCRKPLPGMLVQAAEEHSINLHEAWAAGDTARDITAAAAVGVRTVLLLSGHNRAYDAATFGAPAPNLVCADLPSLADYLITTQS
jgi:histidinol-phosphate phosphatase family protein